MRRSDRVLASLFGLDALAIVGALLSIGSIIVALAESGVWWFACVGVAVTLAAVAARYQLARKLRLRSIKQHAATDVI